MTQNSAAFETQLNAFGISLHRAIINQLIGQIEQAVKDGKIRSQNGIYSVLDFIREILDKKNARDGWKRLTNNVPSTVGFCDSVKFPRKDGKQANAFSPGTDMAGLIWIAYVSESEFSFNLRTSSSQLILADRQNSPQSVNPVEELERSLEAAHTALDCFPFTVEKLWRDSGIVNKSQVKGAILRDFLEGRDYIWVDKRLCMNESTYNILIISFRSVKGADISQLPSIIKLETEKYFQYQWQKKMNKRVAQSDRSSENQMSLFEDGEYA